MLIHVFVVAGLLQQPPYVTKGALHTGMKGQEKMYNLNSKRRLASFEFVSMVQCNTILSGNRIWFLTP